MFSFACQPNSISKSESENGTKQNSGGVKKWVLLVAANNKCWSGEDNRVGASSRSILCNNKWKWKQWLQSLGIPEKIISQLHNFKLKSDRKSVAKEIEGFTKFSARAASYKDETTVSRSHDEGKNVIACPRVRSHSHEVAFVQFCSRQSVM